MTNEAGPNLEDNQLPEIKEYYFSGGAMLNSKVFALLFFVGLIAWITWRSHWDFFMAYS